MSLEEVVVKEFSCVELFGGRLHADELEQAGNHVGASFATVDQWLLVGVISLHRLSQIFMGLLLFLACLADSPRLLLKAYSCSSYRSIEEMPY